MNATLVELARAVSLPLDAPAGFIRSQLFSPESGDEEDAAEVDEWVALDAATARRAAQNGASRVVLRAGPGFAALCEAARVDGVELEAVIAVRQNDAVDLLRQNTPFDRLRQNDSRGELGQFSAAESIPLDEAADAVARALDAGIRIRAALATGPTGIDAYRAAACARNRLGARVPIRVRWDGVLDAKGAALALTFGADELAGPLAPVRTRAKLAQIGGPPEDAGRPSPSYVESLIRAAGRLPVRRFR